MSSKTQTWWDSDYTNYSIRNYHSMPIFEDFSGSRCPLTEELPSGRRTCWEIDNCRIYEWFGADDGEKFGHDLNSDTWFYEHWFLECTTRTVVKSWLHWPFEWGTVIKYHSGKEEHVNWNVGDPDKTLEKYIETSDGREGTRSGTRNSPHGPEDFFETFREKENEKTRQGNWTRGTVKGKYTREETLEYQAGTDKTKEPGKTLQQKWKVTENTQDIVSKGKEGDLKWNEVVYDAPDRHFEEKAWTRDNQTWGYAKENTPINSWEIKWKGKKPEGCFGAFRCNERLFEVYQNIKAGVWESFKTLELMGIYAKEKLVKLRDVYCKFKDPDENDFEAVIAKIEDMNEFNGKLEVLKRDSALAASSNPLFAFNKANIKVPSGLLNISKSNTLSQVRTSLSNKLNEHSDAKELVYNRNQYADILKETTGKLGSEDSFVHDPLIHTTLALQPAFKELLDLLETSYGTIEYIAKNFCIRNSYVLQEKHIRRLEAVRQAFLNKERADVFLEKSLSLLKDFALYEKELLSINELSEMLVSSEASSEALVKALHVSGIPELQNFPSESNLRCLNQRIKLNLILVRKLLGLDYKADGEFESLINQLQLAKPFLSFDLTELIREFRVAGQADQDATQAAFAAFSLPHSDNLTANNLVQTALSAVTGLISSDCQDGLGQFRHSLKTYMQARICQSQLIADLTGRQETALVYSPGKLSKKSSKSPSKARSVKMVLDADIDISGKVVKAITESLDTFMELSSAFEDTSKLQELSKLASEVTESFKTKGTTHSSIEDFLSTILELEKEKKAMLNESETSRSIRSSAETVEQLIQATGQRIAEDLQAQKELFEGHSFGNSSKRTAVLLEALARILHLDLDYEETTKAPTLVSLAFDPRSAVDKLKKVKDSEIAVAELLAKIAGSGKYLGKVQFFKEQLASVFDIENNDDLQAMAILTEYFENSSSILEDLNAFNKSLLDEEITDKMNQLEDLKSTETAQKKQIEAQIKKLERETEKLSQEVVKKEDILKSQKTQLEKANELTKNLQEKLQQKTEEFDKQGQELLVTTREFNSKTENEAQLTCELDYYRNLSEESFALDNEKTELLNSLRGELSKMKESLAERQDIVDSLGSSLEHSCEEKKQLETAQKELEAQLTDLKKQFNESNANYQSWVHQLREEMKEKDEVHQEEVNKLENFIENKQTAFEEQEDTIRNLSCYQSLYISLKEEFEELEKSQSASTIELSLAYKKQDEQSEEVKQLSYKIQSLQNLENDLNNLQTENHKLQHNIQCLEQYSSESLQELISKSNEEIAAKNQELSKLEAELQTEREKLESLQTYHHKCVNRNFMIRLCRNLKRMVDDSFIHWRGLNKNDLTSIGSSIVASAQEEIEGVEQRDIVYAMETVNSANQAMIDNNIILVTYRTASITNEKPLSYINLFKFLEEVMDKKFDTDKRDIADRRQPRSMNEFLMEHLQRSFGIPKLAMKFLGQFVPALRGLYEEDNQYAVFFCRLLHLFHPDPVSYNMGIYLVKIRIEFHSIVEKFERFRQGFGQRTSINKGKTHGRAAYEAAGTGGLALISDVIDLVYTIFAEHKKLGMLTLKLLKPPGISLENYVLYMICHKQAQLGKTPEGIFSMLDSGCKGSISTVECVQGINRSLDLWIQKDTLLFFFQSVSKSEEIQKEDFIKKVNIKFLMNCNKDDTYVITKSAFLTALIEVFKHIQMQDLALLNNHLGNKTTYTFDEFTDAILELDKTIYRDRIIQLYQEACGESKTPTKDNLVKKIIEYGVGGYGLRAFSIRELLDVLSERKMATKSISEDEDRKVVASSVKKTVIRRTNSRK